MKPEPAPNARAARLPWILSFLLVLPVLAYAAVMAISVVRAGYLQFGRIDLAVALLLLAYACVAVFVVGSRNRGAVIRFLLGAYASLLTLAIVEMAARYLDPPPPHAVPWSPTRRVSVAGDTMPGISGTIEFTVNDLGLRGPPVRLDAVDVRILCVGGSTTECLYVTDKLSWPWLLQDNLAQRLGKSVFVGNAGKSNQFSLHHDYLLNHYELAPRFEWVVVLCGINDIGNHMFRHAYEAAKKTVAEDTLTPDSPEKCHLAYYRDLTLIRLLRRLAPAGEIQDAKGQWYTEVRRKRQEALKRNPQREVPEEALGQALLTYRRDLRQIIRTCRKNQQQLVMMTQPTMYRKDLPEDLERLLWASSDTGAATAEVLEQVMAACNQTMIEVCQAEGVDCIDLAAMLPKDTSTFYDDAHFNISGCERVANIVCDFFVAKLKGQD